MADTSPSDDFDKLLDDFIASQLQDAEDALVEQEEKENKNSLTDSEEKALQPAVSSVTDVVSKFHDENIDKLAPEELRLFNAYNEFITAVTACGEQENIAVPSFFFRPSDLLPHFRPSKSQNINQDILNCWEVLIAAQPTRLSSLPVNATDEQILSFAEKTTDTNLQSALISYVETLIELESCEIAYNLRKVNYEKHKIQKKIFEEEQQRLDKMRKYAQAIRAKNFPIDADMLVNNFFKTMRKDPEGAKKILENNPATFAPIQVDKIPPRFFGMIKPKPEDGFRVNRQLGKFLKKLKA